MKERLQKLMAQANIGSRRASEVLIERGRVRVNGKPATLGDKADPEIDVIEVDGVRLNVNQPKVYFALNKPLDVLSTTKPHHDDDRSTITDFVPVSENMHLFTIGRLDSDSEGLMVLTNDGELAHRLSHPSFRHTKTYRVLVDGLPTADTIDTWQRGMWLGDDEGMTAPCLVEITKGGNQTVLKILMTEGKKRQIRRVAAMLGHPVRELQRIQIGMLQIGRLKMGEYRELNAEDVALLSQRSPEAAKIPRRRPSTPRPEHKSGAFIHRPRQGEQVDFDGQSARRPIRLVDDDADTPVRPRRDEDDHTNERPARAPYRASTDRTPSSSDRQRRAPSADRPRSGDNRSADRPRRPNTDQGSSPRRTSSASAPRSTSNYGEMPKWRREGQQLADKFDTENARGPRRDGDSSSSSDRPSRPPSDRPRRDGASSSRPSRPTGTRPTGYSAQRPRRDGDSSASSDRPSRPPSDRPRRDGASPSRPSRPAGTRPTGYSAQRPRRDGDSSSSSDRPSRPLTGRPTTGRPTSGARPPRATSADRPARPPRRDPDEDAE